MSWALTFLREIILSFLTLQYTTGNLAHGLLNWRVLIFIDHSRATHYAHVCT